VPDLSREHEISTATFYKWRSKYAGMTDIFDAHILKATPTQNAIAKAKDAILKLAAKRASSPKPASD
jgi:transposase-like protein